MKSQTETHFEETHGATYLGAVDTFTFSPLNVNWTNHNFWFCKNLLVIKDRF